ncbi:MAG: glycoside hydrolase family 92 protein [Salinivirgaceae bacterium]|jgi:putative alpha-1,2-mannosidase|nr:glycoside hydrolase family 92 protein [Salinivirgaceae bacterium]
MEKLILVYLIITFSENTSESAIFFLITEKVSCVYQGKTFVIEAQNNSAHAPYIQSATLNGKVLDKWYIRHSDIAAGAHLKLIMDENPNKNWGRTEN